MAKRVEKKVILVTGVNGFWGSRVAAGLLQSQATARKPIVRVIGVDALPLASEIKGLNFIQADIRSPLFVELLKTEKVQTVCHLAFDESALPSEAAFDLNVMGTLKVFGACAEAGVHKVVLRSSTAVYGAVPSNPAYITEEHPLQELQGSGYNQHLLEVEAFCNGFRRQAPDLILTILRFPSIIGPKADTPMTRFLKEPLAPSLLGFDPLMQIIHESDVVQALVHAILRDIPGVFNVAAEGVLPLSRLTALAAKYPIPVFHLCAYLGVSLGNSIGLRTAEFWPIEPDYLRYTWVGDLKKMRAELGFAPAYTAEEALREFAGKQRSRQYIPGDVAPGFDEERLHDTLERFKRELSRTEGVDHA